MFLPANVEYDKLELDKILKKFGKNPDQLIPILQEVQEKIGYLPKDADHFDSLEVEAGYQIAR